MQPIERIVFFGTPDFAVASLEALIAAGRRPRLVVSQPARPAGRGRRLSDPPVALRARELGIPLAQPPRVRAAEFVDRLRALRPDLAVVVAFGQIFPRELLDLPRLGCLNVHASLLPRWRGAAPIAAAIAAGDARTGVAIQRMEEGLDTGPVYAERSTEIAADQTVTGLTERLALLGAGLLVEVVAALERGEALAIAQDDRLATWAPKQTGVRLLTLEQGAAAIAREVRAFHPEPGVVLDLAGERVKLIEVASRPEQGPAPVASAATGETGAGAGSVVSVDARGLALTTAVGVLELVAVQRPGGKVISGRDLANGLRLKPGDRLN